MAMNGAFSMSLAVRIIPQSNGLAENAVKQATNLLCKCKDSSDPLLGLLNLRNVPTDQTLGSLAQQLMSSQDPTSCRLKQRSTAETGDIF